MNFLATKKPIDQYLDDVSSYLPRKNRKDIVDELRVNLTEQFADHCELSGEALTEESQIKMLSEFGHPLKVASKYQGSSTSFISPTLFPFYRMSILISLVVSTVILCILLICKQVFGIDLDGAYGPWMFVNTYITIVGVITIGYGLTEYVMERNHYLESWEPNGIAQPHNVLASAWGALISCVAAITWLVILDLIATGYSLQILLGDNPNPIYTLVLWMKIQMLVLVPQYFYLVVNQTWSRNRLVLFMASELILAVGCVIVLLTNAESLSTMYPELPQFLNAAFYYVISGMIAASLLSAFSYWRKSSRLTISNLSTTGG